MRHPYSTQPDLQITPVEKIRLPLKSRDELPPILAGLQWVWMHPTLKAEILALLAAKILAGKQATGRTGMDLWQILVLGVVRLGLDADWDRMEDMANHHLLVRQMLGVPVDPWGQGAKVFGHQTLRDNVALLDDELLQQINARIAAAGREVFAKKEGAPLAAPEVKVDSYVLETDVHFPTDLNLLWDAGRKCVDLIEGLLASDHALPGWRTFKSWRRQLKACERTASHLVYRGGPNREARVKRVVRAARRPVAVATGQNVRFVNRREDFRHRLLQQLVRQRRDAPGPPFALALGDVFSAPQSGVITLGLQPPHEVGEVRGEVLCMILEAHAIHARRGVPPPAQEAGPKAFLVEQPIASAKPVSFVLNGLLGYGPQGGWPAWVRRSYGAGFLCRLRWGVGPFAGVGAATLLPAPRTDLTPCLPSGRASCRCALLPGSCPPLARRESAGSPRFRSKRSSRAPRCDPVPSCVSYCVEAG